MTSNPDLLATSRTLTLMAPLSGYLVPIERVPDPVFSQKMVGDGIALDPVSQSLVAPCDGEVIMLHPANHALTLAIADGIELLMHIGLDTINLKGEGFTPRVKNGDKVKAGDPLIDFDADFVATHAKSLLTMIVVTNPDRVASFRAQAGIVTIGRDPILDLELAHDGAKAAAEAAGVPIISEAILLSNTAGLHARPAAVLANVARKFAADIWVQRGDGRANAKSLTSLMNLDIRYNDKVNLVAQGSDAQDAINSLVPLILSGLGEEGSSAPAPASRIVAEIARPAPVRRSEDPNLLLGVTAAPGFAVGTVFQVRHQDLAVAETADEPQAEEVKLAGALETSRRQLEALQYQLHGQADANKAIVEAVLRDQHTVMTVSSPLSGQYGVSDIAISMPAIVGRRGVEKVLNLPLSESELAAFQNSVQTLKDRLADVR